MKFFYKFSKLLQGNPFPEWRTMKDVVCVDDSTGTDSYAEQEESYVETQVGLKLPNGEIIWPPDEYKGYPIAEAEDRAILLEVFKKTADDLHFTTEGFLGNYSWVTRQLKTIVISENSQEIPITDAMAFGDDKAGSNDYDHQDDYGGAVHEGFLGSSV